MPTNPDRPYGKINLLSRKKRDQKNVAFLNKKLEEGGSHTFEKKSNKPMEVVKGTFIAKRGTKVSGGSKTEFKKDPSTTETKTVVTPGKVTKSYEPADVRTGSPKYGKESLTKPTPQFIKDAQAEKKDIVTKNNLDYRAGYTKETKSPDQVSTTTKLVPGKISIVKKKEVNVSEPKPAPARNSGGIKLMKRRADTVPWLTGKKANLKKEAGHGR